MNLDALGPMATKIRAALAECKDLRAQGFPESEIAKGFEQVVREVWPKPHDRTTPWRYACEECSDYGLRMFTCPGDATCGRVRPHAAHEYGEPCWCSAGRRHQEKPKASPDDTDGAARPSKRRWGR